MKLLRYHEVRQRGTLDFPLEYHYLDKHHPRYQMPYHWHDEYEILQVQTGCFEMTLDDEIITLYPGDAAFIAAGILHGGIPQECTYECVVFDMRLLLKCNDHCKQQVGEILHRRLAVQNCFRKENRVIRHTIPPMFEALRTQCAGWELITLGCLFQFLGECFKHGAYQLQESRNMRDGKRTLQLKTVFEMIENDYSQSLTLEALSDAVHMTPKYFCRFFKAATHRTPIDYLNYYRIEAACYELAATDKNITEVALDNGFSSSSYFIRLFRKYKGVTPGQYLSNIRQTNGMPRRHIDQGMEKSSLYHDPDWTFPEQMTEVNSNAERNPCFAPA